MKRKKKPDPWWLPPKKFFSDFSMAFMNRKPLPDVRDSIYKSAPPEMIEAWKADGWKEPSDE